MNTKRNKIKAFDAFGKALRLLDTQDRELYSWPRNRLSLCHALAMHLDSLFQDQKQKLSVDLCPVLNRSPKALNPDILVHNRTTNAQVLAVICRSVSAAEPVRTAAWEWVFSFRSAWESFFREDLRAWSS